MVIGYEWILFKNDGIGMWKFSAIKHLDELRVHVSYVSLAAEGTEGGEALPERKRIYQQPDT